MYFLPNCPKPFEDELMLSWLCRLAGRNVMSFRDLMIFVYDKFSKNMDIQMPLQEIFKRIKPFMWPCANVSELFMRTTLYPFYAVSMFPEQQLRYVYKYISDSNYILNKHGNFGKLKVCPECLKEDYLSGGCYMHRSHQLSGVNVCYKHGCFLLELSKDKIMCSVEMKTIYDSNNFVEIGFLGSQEEEYQYAQAAHDLLNASLDTNIFEFKSVINRALKERGYEEGLKSPRLIREFNQSAYSFGKKLPDNYFINISYTGIKMSEKLLNFLLYIYNGDISLFINEVKAIRHDKPVVPDSLELLAPYDKPIKTYICKKCGEFFISNDWGIENGLGCPKCVKSEAEFYEGFLKIMLRDEYLLAEAVKDKNTPVKVKHNVCDEYFAVKPIDFVFKHKRCDCANKLSFKEVVSRVNKVPGYELVSYQNGTSRPVILRHSGGCGKTFECSLDCFTKTPFCRVCEGKMSQDTFLDKVKDLVGDEYTPVSLFETWHMPIKIRHNVCGKEFEVSPGHFLNGNRCPYCAKFMTKKYFRVLVNDLTSGHYSVMPKNKNYGFEYLFDNSIGKVLKLTKPRIKQEVLRPTRSDILVLTEQEEQERLKKLENLKINGVQFNIKENFYVYLCNTYGKNDLIFSDELNKSGLSNDTIVRVIRDLVRQGRIRKIHIGLYVFSENVNDYTTEEILYNKYVCRNGKTIGKFVKASEKGFKEDRYLSTKISLKTAWQKYSFAGVKVFGKGITSEQLEEMIK